MSQNLQNFVKFQKFQLENLVDFEKCCKTHIFLQKSEPIQPKTSNILPKFCQPTLSDVSARRAGRRGPYPPGVTAAAGLRGLPRRLRARERFRLVAQFVEVHYIARLGKLWRARSRLYRSQMLQVNNTKYAFDSIFFATLLQRSRKTGKAWKI